MIEQLADQRGFQKVVDKLVMMAWHRYRLPRPEAEDIAHTAVTTYLEVRERYTGESNQKAILIGIFRKKCLEFIDRSVRERSKLERYGKRLRHRRRRARLDPGQHVNGQARFKPEPVVDRIIHDEDVDLILEALSELRPEAREMLLLLVVQDVGRKGLIERYRLNENTLDSRLHVYRNELRRLLQEKGVLD